MGRALPGGIRNDANTTSPAGTPSTAGASDFLKGMNPVTTTTKGVQEASDFLKGHPTISKVLGATTGFGAGAAAAGSVMSPAQPAAPPAADAGAGGAQNPYDVTFGTMQPGAMGGSGSLQLTPPRYVAPHFDSSRIPYRGTTVEGLYGALDNTRSIEAGQDLARVQANAADVSANILEQEAQRAQYDRAQRLEAEQQRKSLVREQIGRAKQLNEEAQRGSVDPSKFFREPGGILTSLGAVLRVAGGSNEGMAALERAQGVDMQLQKAEIDKKRQAGLDAENTLAQYQRAFGDERAAELAWEADARDVARMKLLALAERSQSPQIMAHAQLLATQLAEGRDAKRADLTARFDQISYVPGQVVGGGPAQQSKPLEHVVNLPNGVSLQMPTKELQEKAIGKIAITEQIKRNNDMALRLRDEARKNPGKLGTIKQQLTDLREDTMAMISLAREQGVVKDAEFERAKSSTAAYLELSPGTDETIRQNTNRLVENLGFFMRATGAEQVQRGYTQVPGKGTQPTGAYTGNNVAPQAVQDPRSFQLQMPAPIKSSIFSKMPAAGSGPANATFDVLGPGGEMDVMGSLQAHGNYGTRFNADPSGGMMGGAGPFGILSSEKAKQPAGFKLEDAGSFMPILGADAGTHQTNEGRSFVVQQDQSNAGASLSGPVPQYSSAPAAPRAQPMAAPAQRQMSPDEMSRWAEQMIRQNESETAARGPTVRPDDRGSPDLASAARAQMGGTWAYKPEFAPMNQAPGEVNVGPIAERMQMDPLAATAVKPGADGLPELDPNKTLTLNAAINGDQQKQLDRLAAAVAHLRGGRR